MIRDMIHIDPEKCNGCGQCAAACQEGAIAMVDGKAQLLRDDYCDGLGNCLPACPTGAITIQRREAVPFDEAAVAAHMAKATPSQQPACGCPGSTAKTLHQPAAPDAPAAPAPPLACGCPGSMAKTLHHSAAPAAPVAPAAVSQLAQWPVQIQLVPANAPYLDGADLLVAADCTPFAYGDFHNKFMRGKVTLVGCPKLDSVDYSDKLTEILQNNDIHSLRVVRMQVPCCGGIENAVKQALMRSGKLIPWGVTVLSTDGQIIQE